MIQFYFGKINTYGEEEDHPKYIKVGHTSYRVTAQEVDKDFGSLVYTYPSPFHLMVKVMIFAYRVSSRESFLELDRIYSDFLKPQDGGKFACHEILVQMVCSLQPITTLW